MSSDAAAGGSDERIASKGGLTIPTGKLSARLQLPSASAQKIILWLMMMMG